MQFSVLAVHIMTGGRILIHTGETDQAPPTDGLPSPPFESCSAAIKLLAAFSRSKWTSKVVTSTFYSFSESHPPIPTSHPFKEGLSTREVTLGSRSRSPAGLFGGGGVVAMVLCRCCNLSLIQDCLPLSPRDLGRFNCCFRTF